MELVQNRTAAFKAIDKSGNGVINFLEWLAHFKDLVAKTNLSEEELKMMFNIYDKENSTPGIDLSEYNSFMNDVFGPES